MGGRHSTFLVSAWNHGVEPCTHTAQNSKRDLRIGGYEAALMPCTVADMTDPPARTSDERGLREQEAPRLQIRLVQALARELEAIYAINSLSHRPASEHRKRLDRLVVDHIYTTNKATVVIETYRGGDMQFTLSLSESYGDGEPENTYTVYVQPSFLSPGFGVHATYWGFERAVLVKKTKRLTAIETAFTRFLEQLVEYVPHETKVVVEGCA